MFHNIYSCYLTMATVVFVVWFFLFLLDQTTPKNHFISWLVLLIAPLFWPIVLPLSIKELIVKARKKRIPPNKVQVEEALINLQTNELNVN